MLWPKVMARRLQVEVISEGLGGRTTIYDDFTGSCDRNGSRVLPILLQSHSPLDIVIIMLGTNDLKPTICGTAEGAASGIRKLVSIIRRHDYRGIGPIPEIIVAAPPPCVIGPDGLTGGGRSISETRRLSKLYNEVASELGTQFFDAGQVAIASPVDGVHLDADNTAAIGVALADFISASQRA